ncbi:MAG: nucleotide exchange factor GrpE [Okeania sp. SIO3B3]|nr:nucleotide exchange factor GrpE [Okeania sp. SIO3B3]
MNIDEYEITTTLKKDAVYQWVEAVERNQNNKFILQIVQPDISPTVTATIKSYFDDLLGLRRKGIWGHTKMFETAEYPLVLVYPYISTISLQEVLKQTPSNTLPYWYQASERLHALHNKNIVHGRISLDSFVIDADQHLYLTNFGYAPVLAFGLEVLPEYQEVLAPEVLEQQLVTPAADIYGFAKTVVNWQPELTKSEWYLQATDSNPKGRFQRIRQLFGNLKESLSSDEGGIIPKYILEVKVEPSTAGKITGGGSYPAMEKVSVQAIPSSGWKFKAWSGALTGMENPAIVTMDDNKRAIALFFKVPEPPSDLSEEILELKELVFVLKKQLEEVPKLKQQVSILEKQLEEVPKLKQQVSILEKQLKENRLYPKQKIVETALKEDQEQWEKDEVEFKTYRQEFQQLQTWGNELQQSIKSLVKNCQQKLFEYQPITFLELKQKLQLGKMLRRLPEQTNLSVTNETLPEELPKITEPELIEIVNKTNTEKDIEVAIKNKLKQVGNKRWQIVSECRKLVLAYHKRLLNFFEKKVLPILDGIDEGEKYSRELKTECSDDPNILESLLQLHDDLRQIVLKILELVNIRPIEVQIGTPIDYNCHEPFDIQPDVSLPNEVITEVTRKGYEYQLEESQGWQVLRPAQVIVVKNN